MNNTSPYYPKEVIGDFIPYDLAKRLEGLGFNERCFGFWSTKYDSTYNNKPLDEPFLWVSYESHQETARLRHVEIDCPAPLWQQAVRWIFKQSNEYVGTAYIPIYTDEELREQLEIAIDAFERYLKRTR